MRNIMLFAILILMAAPFASADAGARCPDGRTESPVALTLISPGDVLVLKTDLTVRYGIAPGVKFAEVKLRVTNKKGELVYLGADLPAIAGEHQAVWPKAMWNQTPHVGALANPRNGPYAIALVAKGADGLSTTFTVSLPTQLVVQCDLWDGKPSKDEISSGLYRPMLDPKSPECLRVGLVRKGGKVADTVYAPNPPEFSNIVEADLDNDPSDGLEIESARIRQVMPSTFPDGVYNVVFANCRDLAGNRGVGGGLPDGIMPKWIVTLR